MPHATATHRNRTLIMSYFTYTQLDLDTAVAKAIEVTKANYLAELMEEAYQVAVSKGWEEDAETRSFGDETALLHSEISEAFEAYRRRGFDYWEGENGKPEGVGPEFADEFIRLLHYCRCHGFDLQFEYDRKTAYNRTRAHRHGGKRL
jgi:NTP pyrophosphatase (non-canonical NTP hydrolase)